MPDESSASIKCPGCGKKYRWDAKIAGRKVRCKCGASLRVPAEPPGAATKSKAPGQPLVPPDEVDPYELTDPDAPATLKHADAGPGKCPSCGQKVKPEAVICVGCGYNLKEGKQLKTELGTVDVEKKSIFGMRKKKEE